MHRQFEKILVASVRTTMWEKGERPEGEKHEIIEIGLCFLHVATLEIAEKETILLRPQHSRISDFCTKLTTLTQEQVEKEGMAFPSACVFFKHRYLTHKYAWASFGEDHRLLIERECAARGAPYPMSPHYLNVRLLATVHLQLAQAPSLARTLHMLELAPEEGEYCAGDAAWNTARVLAFFLGRLREV